MSQFWSLALLQLRMDYGLASLKERLGLGTKRVGTLLYLLLFAVAFLPIIGFVYKMAESVTLQSALMDEIGLPVVSAIVAGQFSVLFVAVSGMMSSLYYSEDMEILLAMPLSPKSIVMAKSLSAYVGQIFMSTLFTGPYLVALGSFLGQETPFYWPFASVLYLSIPLIPLALSLSFVAVLMRFTKNAKGRDLFRVLFGLLFFIVLMSLQLLSTNVAKHGPGAIMDALTERNGLIRLMSRYYPLLGWGADALTGSTLKIRALSLIFFVGVSLGFLALALKVSTAFFLGGVQTGTGDGLGDREKKGRWGSRLAPHMAVLLKDQRLLVRTPNHLLVMSMNLAVVPVFLIVFAVAGDIDLDQIRLLFHHEAFRDFIPFVAAGIQGASLGINQMASTCISREGAGFWISKVIPVSPKEQVKGKLLHSVLFASLQLAILIGTFGFVFRPSIFQYGAILLLGLMVSWPLCAMALMSDIANPRLKWTNPQAATKGNFMTLVAGVLAIAYLFLVGGILVSMFRMGIPMVSIYITAIFLLTGSGFLLGKGLERLAESRYPKIEV